ncbi:MAG: TonB-dependent receptor [Bacteroidia bacterium]
MRDRRFRSQVSAVLGLALLLCAGLSLRAQSGVVRGIVREEQSQVLLSGARVSIDSLRIGAITDVNGAFVLGNVPPGSHLLRISYLTYEGWEMRIDLAPREVRALEVDMSPITLMGEEVVITAQALGQTQAINQQLNLDAIAHVVSADRIQELPDVNAAEAIARLPGVALNRSGGEGQKVVIRGLEPKFAQITVNGVALPSNSGTDRSVDLSLIAPELLDGIEVFKSPLPDMDAEALGGTVNLRLRKAPRDFRLLAKGLWGYNELNNDPRDHKAIVQMSRRVFDDRLGVVFQAGAERFNRGGDLYQRTWRQGRTNDTTGVTEILGGSLRLEDRQEIRRRYNSSLGLDYQLGRSAFSFFGLYSLTTRDRFEMQERYEPSESRIQFIGNDIQNSLDLLTLSLTGNHNLGPLQIDWTLANSRSQGRTPYDFTMTFQDNTSPFAGTYDRDGDPASFLAVADPELPRTVLLGADARQSAVSELTRAATLNFELPYKLGDKVFGSLRFGGKYKTIDRDRSVELLSENFYYLGSEEARRAIGRYEAYRDTVGGANALAFLPQNDQIMTIGSFLQENDVRFEGQDGERIPLYVNIDPDQMRHWYDSQRDILNPNREVLVDNYEVEESVAAAYMMLKFKVGEWLTLIPGFRYEHSDNAYRSGLSTINGRYGVNGFYFDTTTYQRYGELLPHLHLKLEPLAWLDIRASYAKTLARPDFEYITPRIQINESNAEISAGNPNLQHAVSTNYDLSVTAYKGGYGLISVGLFRKDIRNIFYPWETNLVDDSTAQAYFFPDYRGYTLNSYTNSSDARVYGYEVDLQTTFSFLPKPFSGLVLNVNYARLFSTTEVFFLTREQRLIVPFPPIFQTIYNNETREVQMRSQAPHVLRASLGYDYLGFSVRVSVAYQGTKPGNYSVNKDFDTFDRAFWRVDASMKQNLGERWSLFLNLNNLSNQQDISFTRDLDHRNTIETYGLTGTLGVQYSIR